MADIVYKVNVLDTGAWFFCKGDQVLLEAMIQQKAGLISCGCFGGGCGICKIQIVRGEYTQFKKMSAAHVTDLERRQRMVLACCVKPCSDLAIKIIKIK